MTRVRARLLVALLAISLAAPALAAAPLYRWKDAGGIVHFSDTPPPASAIRLKASTPSPSVVAPSPVCRSDISSADCAAATAALGIDAADIANSSPAGSSEESALDPRIAELHARECAEQKAMLAALQRRKNDTSTEIMTASEEAGLPTQTADVERFLAASCKP